MAANPMIQIDIKACQKSSVTDAGFLSQKMKTYLDYVKKIVEVVLLKPFNAQLYRLSLLVLLYFDLDTFKIF